MTCVPAMQVQYVFLDSGIGGLPYFSYFKTQVPYAKAVYIADTAHFPYGEKTRNEIQSYARTLTAKILDVFAPEVIVLVCNTLSVTALDMLRKEFDIPFVGTVPAVKQAAAVSRNKRIGIIATGRTIQEPYLDELINRYAADCFIEKRGDSPLVARIEQGLVFDDVQIQNAAVAPAIRQFTAAGTDTIVLACTHFLHIAAVFERNVPRGTGIIDSRQGVIAQLLRIAPPHVADTGSFQTTAAPPAGHGSGTACYGTGLITSQTEKRYLQYCKQFGLTWKGSLL